MTWIDRAVAERQRRDRNRVTALLMVATAIIAGLVTHWAIG